MADQRPISVQFPEMTLTYLDSLKNLGDGRSCLIAGTGSSRRGILKRIRRSGLNVNIIGFVEESSGDSAETIDGMRVFQSGALPEFDTLIMQGRSWFSDLTRYAASGVNSIGILPCFDPNSSTRTCIVCHETGLIYVPNYKVLYSSIREFLRSRFSEFTDLPETTHALNSNVNLESPEFADYVKFTVIRNPWDRVTSCFRDKMEKPSNVEFWQTPLAILTGKNEARFEDFVQFISTVPDTHSDPHWRSQYGTLVNGSKTKLLVDHVARLDTLNDSMAELEKLTGVHFALEQLNATKSASSSYRTYYSAETALAIGDRYVDDISFFDFKY